MFSLYETADQGKHTRSQLLAILQQRDGLTRQELVAAGLTYDQARRQTANLIFERQVYSQRDTTGRRRYYLRQNFTQRLGTLALVVLMAWPVPVGITDSGTDNSPFGGKGTDALRLLYEERDRPFHAPRSPNLFARTPVSGLGAIAEV